MPLLYWKFVNAIYAPGMGIYEKTKKNTIAGRHMRSSVRFCDTTLKKLGFLYVRRSAEFAFLTKWDPAFPNVLMHLSLTPGWITKRRTKEPRL